MITLFVEQYSLLELEIVKVVAECQSCGCNKKGERKMEELMYYENEIEKCLNKQKKKQM